ncbi:MAG TPA: DNA mismatch repair protein MutS, partial [Opitutae bacterium]|nr:DNA mismatch repair protein MutS [Opitutae bacterium]
MMRQYALIHQKLPENTILFFRLGDFYEMFFGDAETCARILGLTLTQRNGMPMAGIPFHASETYIDKLLKAGKKVAICDQMEEPKPGKLVDRALTRILTPGTVLEDAQIEASSNQYIVCVDQQSELLCAAWMDLSTSEFKIASESDIDSLISFLISLNPKEIVISESLTSEQRNRLTYLLQNRAVSTVPSYLFNAVNARSHLEQLFEVQHLDGFGLTTDEPALSCADALVFYITENLCHSPKNLKKLTRYHCKKALLMDSATAQNLEIFQTQRGTREGSLWQFLDVAKTAAGSRLIQRFLISPLIDLEEITYRQNCIEAFYKASMATHALQSYLPRTRDITRILARLHNRLRSPRELGAILTTLQQLPAIQTLVNQIPSDELRALAQKIQLFDELKTLLQSALNDDLPNDLLAGGYIRSGYDPPLDHLRSAQQESQEWLQRFEEREQQS